MDMTDALERVCAEVGIALPRDRSIGRWLTTDTLSGKNGKGDGRVIINADCVTAWNWQSGQRATARPEGEMTLTQKREAFEQREAARRKRASDAERAAANAVRLLDRSRPSTHPYLALKGFPSEKTQVVDAETVAAVAGSYLVPDSGQRAIIIPARIKGVVRSCQLIWEAGEKKFLFGGEMGGATHVLSHGRDTWLCEGFATGLSLRAALRLMNRSDAIVCCFSASNIAAVAPSTTGRVWIAADHDKPHEPFKGLGTGEHYARIAGKPYAMPPEVGTDINDMHVGMGLYEVQRLLSATIRGVAA